MVTCPWCGTTYNQFQPNCTNCGGALPKELENQAATAQRVEDYRPASPPLAPRQVPENYVWRSMTVDGWVIASVVFLMLGVIFAPLGLALTITLVTAFVGLPFLFLGGAFLLFAIPVLILRYQSYKRRATILRQGQSALGKIQSLEQNYSVMINNRHPWIITYTFMVHGEPYEERFSTIRLPHKEFKPGAPVYVLFDPNDPHQNILYPPIY